MPYKILSAHLEQNNNTITLVAVLWQSNEMGWVRASYCTQAPVQGYKFLMPDEELNNDLIQSVAGAGMNLPDNLKKKYFPGKYSWER
jgi:hypothetical protein